MQAEEAEPEFCCPAIPPHLHRVRAACWDGRRGAEAAGMSMLVPRVRTGMPWS